MSLFDLQVNGYAGVDFNQDDLTAEQLHATCQMLERDGVTAILATFITEQLDVMVNRLQRMVALRDHDPLAQRVIVGLHVEGPFISPVDGYRGAHPVDAVRPAHPDQMQRLLDAAGGLIRVVTLAPECDPDLATTRMLAKQGVVVSAGHTNATLEQLTAAADAGLSMMTHVGNGCPPQLPRHDNIVQRALALADRLWLCFIADGAHVPFFALANYLKAASLDRSIVVSDAIAPAGLGPGTYTLSRWQLVIDEDLVARAPDGSHLVGSALSLPRAANNLRQHLHLSDQAVDKLTEQNPLRALSR